MDILLGDITALRLWRTPAVCSMARAMRPEPLPAHGLGCDAALVARLCERYGLLAGLPHPLDLFVPQAPLRRESALVKPHVFPGVLASGTAYRLAEHVFISSPKTMPFQLAQTHNRLALAKKAFELCGTYGRSPQAEQGFFAREPLATIDSLRRFARQQQPGTRGRTKLLQALVPVEDNAASPMESLVALHLGLSGRLGGYNLGHPLLNTALAVPDRLQKAAGRQSVRPDLYYPNGRVAVEYDSDLYHSASERIGSDSKRRTALELMGIRVVPLTRAQFMDPSALDAAAALIARLLGRQLPRVHDFHVKQLQLRAQLLDFSQEL